MRRKVGLIGIGLMVVLGSRWMVLNSQTLDTAGTITGVVTSQAGPEAGVWVIAETDDLDTKFRKIVVTNDEGRFLLPDLPEANYEVWARGYGLVDSRPVMARSGDVALSAALAATSQEAAEIYPSNYWLSLLEPPKASEFPGTGPDGNGIHPSIKTRDEFMFGVNACLRCHQVGNKWTREVPSVGEEYDSTVASWDIRVRMGQRGPEMSSMMTRLGRERGLRMFADWADRIAGGEVPAAPPRPTGVERNVVLTQWEWTTEMGKIHDEVSTDKRNPRVNANGPVYGTNIANDYLAIVDPVKNTAKQLRIPTLAERVTMRASYASTYPVPSRISDLDRFNPTSIHNPMLDSQGRVWYTATLRPREDQPNWCLEGADNRYANYFPLARSGRNVSYYDPKTGEFTMIDTCAGTHHLQFGFDEKETLYMGQPNGAVFSWIDTKQFDRTGNGQQVQGWCPTVVDTNGDGRITKPWNEPADRAAGLEEDDSVGSAYPNFDPTRDTRVEVGAYGIVVSPVDGSVWGAQETYPGKIVRLAVGDNPPESCVAEVFEVPSERWGVAAGGEKGFKPRGIDVDRDGVIWTALAGSGHMASFDRRKCGVLTGPTAHSGQQCAEGWTLYPLPALRYKGTDTLADFYYYNWVDQFNTLGLGENVPIATGTISDSLIALLPETGERVVMRVPYPLGGFHPRGLDGRIDDPSAGWKGRGVYSSTGADTVWHTEGGLAEENGEFKSVSKPILVKFQIRPDPLAN